jgi:hypothetical protein
LAATGLQAATEKIAFYGSPRLDVQVQQFACGTEWLGGNAAATMESRTGVFDTQASNILSNMEAGKCIERPLISIGTLATMLRSGALPALRLEQKLPRKQ